MPQQFPAEKKGKDTPPKKRENQISLPFWWRVKSHWHKQIPLFGFLFLLLVLTADKCA